jgi:sulfur relay (sulfurtransferase) complex TusBCD TusD component (DsrE family)
VKVDIKTCFKKGGKIKLYGGCIDARGVASLQILEGCEKSNMSGLAQYSVEADKVFTF